MLQSRLNQGDRLVLKRGQIIGLPQVVSMIENFAAINQAELILGLMETPGILMSDTGTDFAIIDVREVSGEWCFSISASEGLPSRAITKLGDLLKIPDELTYDSLPVGDPRQYIDVPILDRSSGLIWNNVYVGIRYAESFNTYNTDWNVQWLADWVSDGKVIKVRSYKIIQTHNLGDFESTDIVLGRIVKQDDDTWEVTEDLRNDSIFTLKKAMWEKSMEVEVPEIKDFSIIGLNINLILSHPDLKDLQAFEIYIAYTDLSENPFLTDEGLINPAAFTDERFFGYEKKLNFQIPITSYNWNKYATVIVKACSSEHFYSDWAYSTIKVLLGRAPKPENLVVLTGLTEYEEKSNNTIQFRSIGTITVGTQPISVTKMDVPSDVFVCAMWGEKHRVVDSIIIRGATVPDFNFMNKIVIEDNDGMNWKDGAFQTNKIALIDADGNAFVSKILESTVDRSSGKGVVHVTVDTPMPVSMVGASRKKYIIFPDTNLTYLIKLEAIDENKSQMVLPGSGNNYMGLMNISVANTMVQSIMETPEAEALLNPDAVITSTEYKWHGLPYGKKYKVYVAAMYGKDRRTLSGFVESETIYAGIKVMGAVPVFDVTNFLRATLIGSVMCEVDFSVAMAALYKQIRVVWSYENYADEAAAKADTTDFFGTADAKYVSNIYTIGFAKDGNWKTMFNMIIPVGRWVRVKIKGLTIEGLYGAEVKDYVFQTKLPVTEVSDINIPSPMQMPPPSL